MNIQELITILQIAALQSGDQTDVVVQASGCCCHAHPIQSVELASESPDDGVTRDVICVVVRA